MKLQYHCSCISSLIIFSDFQMKAFTYEHTERISYESTVSYHSWQLSYGFTDVQRGANHTPPTHTHTRGKKKHKHATNHVLMILNYNKNTMLITFNCHLCEI